MMMPTILADSLPPPTCAAMQAATPATPALVMGTPLLATAEEGMGQVGQGMGAMEMVMQATQCQGTAGSRRHTHTISPHLQVCMSPRAQAPKSFVLAWQDLLMRGMEVVNIVTRCALQCLH